MEKTFMMADEVAEIAGVSKSKGYAIIRQLNSELEAQGFITIAGRVSRKYFSEKYYGYFEGAASDGQLSEHTERT